MRVCVCVCVREGGGGVWLRLSPSFFPIVSLVLEPTSLLPLPLPLPLLFLLVLVLVSSVNQSINLHLIDRSVHLVRNALVDSHGEPKARDKAADPSDEEKHSRRDEGVAKVKDCRDEGRVRQRLLVRSFVRLWSEPRFQERHVDWIGLDWIRLD